MKVRCYLVFVAVLLAALPIFADPADVWVAKARSFLGSERALNAVKSIHFNGELKAADGKDYPIEIIFQQPYQQRISVHGTSVIETTALDGYDAWQKRALPDNPAKWQVVLLDAGQVKRLRANTLENLSFYWGHSSDERQVKYLGEDQTDGVACVKISFTHSPDIIFIRYFEKSTGRLVKTVTENGTEIREEGAVVIDGIRFPKKVSNQTADGRSTTISFEKIAVNEKFTADTFSVPSMQFK